MKTQPPTRTLLAVLGEGGEEAARGALPLLDAVVDDTKTPCLPDTEPRSDTFALIEALPVEEARAYVPRLLARVRERSPVEAHALATLLRIVDASEPLRIAALERAFAHEDSGIKGEALRAIAREPALLSRFRSEVEAVRGSPLSPSRVTRAAAVSGSREASFVTTK